MKKSIVNQGRTRKQAIRYILGVLIILVSLFISFMLIPQLYARQGDVVTALTANTVIPKGKIIESSDLLMKEVGAYNIIPDYITEISVALGATAAVDILPGDIITPSKIDPAAGDPYLNAIAKEGNKLISVSINTNAAGVGGNLLPGDIVRLYFVYEDEDGKSRILAPFELKELKVYSISNSSNEELDRVKDDNSSLSRNMVVDTVTLIASDIQVMRILEGEYEGKIHLALVRR